MPTDRLSNFAKKLNEYRQRQRQLTPKGEPMPQTVEEWQHLYGLAEAAMLRMASEISALKHTVNQLRQKLKE
jgi:HAMP domain-containing protein